MKKTILTVIIALITLSAIVVAGRLVSKNTDSQGEEESFTPSQVLRDQDMKRIPVQTETVNVLACGVDLSQELTDVIMYVQYDPRTGEANVLSIPRDTFLGEEYATGKINQVYRQTGSMDALVDEVRERFLLDVDYYATITLDALGSIVDQVGGVEITMEQDLYDNGQLLFHAGEQLLNGDQAQMFVRIRHAYANADLGRIDAQHQFLFAALKKVQSLGKLKMLQLIMNNFTAVKTNMPLSKVVTVAASAFHIGEEDIHMFTAPGVGKMNGSYAVYEMDREGLAEILNEHFLSEPVTADELGFPTVEAPPYSGNQAAEPEETSSVPEAEEPEEPPVEEEPEESEASSDDGKPHARKLTPEEIAQRRAEEQEESDWRIE